MRFLPWDTEWGKGKELVCVLSFAKICGFEKLAQPFHPSKAFVSWMKMKIFIWRAYYALLWHTQTRLNGYLKKFSTRKIGHVKMPGIQLSLPSRQKIKRKKPQQSHLDGATSTSLFKARNASASLLASGLPQIYSHWEGWQLSES